MKITNVRTCSKVAPNPVIPATPQLLVGMVLWLIASSAFAQFFDIGKEDPLRIAPKGTISLEYPNQWDFNRLIALSHDGRFLIDASETARNVRVWDWEKKEVAQRLLLNEDTPELNDGKQHKGVLQYTGGGRGLALTPDGRMVAACVNLSTELPPTAWSGAKVRVWNLASGAVEANIPAVARNVSGLDHDAILTTNCNSISFSPDGKYIAITTDFWGAIYTNEAHVLNFKTTREPPINVTGIALYETRSWQLLRFIPMPYGKLKQGGNKQELHSRVLFSSDSKQVSGVVFERNSAARGVDDRWVANRIVRWEVGSGALLEEKNVPKLGPPNAGIWWHWLPGEREVWWSTYAETQAHLYQTQAEARQCEADSAAPAFVSEAVENCAYNWAIAILDFATGKIKYLAPFKKNPPQPNSMERELGSFVAGISPDGNHLILVSSTSKPNTIPPVNQVSRIDVLDRETLRLEGQYTWSGGLGEPVFSGDSKFLVVKAYRSGKSAMIFEIPQKNKFNSREGK